MDSYTKEIKLEFNAKESIKKIGEELTSTLSTGLQKTMSAIGTDLKNVFNDIVDNFKVSMEDVISEMSDMLDYSQLSSSTTRDLAFGYGFSSSEAYGYEKALSAVGLESEEDLFYANTQELEQFREAFEKYSSQYESLYDSGFFETMQEYQYEMADFKNEMQLEIIEFFMNNKDTIKAGMNAIMDISEVVLKIFGWLVDVFGSDSNTETAAASDIVSQYTNTNTNNTTVSVSNTFNNVAKEDESWLANAGSMTYEQVITALGGKN